MSEQCPSSYRGARCIEPAGHDGDHYHWGGATHITTWHDAAQDAAGETA